MATDSETLRLYSGIFEQSTAGETIISGISFSCFCITIFVLDGGLYTSFIATPADLAHGR